MSHKTQSHRVIKADITNRNKINKRNSISVHPVRYSYFNIKRRARAYAGARYNAIPFRSHVRKRLLEIRGVVYRFFLKKNLFRFRALVAKKYRRASTISARVKTFATSTIVKVKTERVIKT